MQHMYSTEKEQNQKEEKKFVNHSNSHLRPGSINNLMLRSKLFLQQILSYKDQQTKICKTKNLQICLNLAIVIPQMNEFIGYTC